MENALKNKITQDVTAAMKAQNKDRLQVLRLLTASIKQLEVDQNKRESGLSEQEIVQVLTKMIKQRDESIELYKKANREDLIKQELFEKNILAEYLPEQLSEDKIKAIITAAVAEVTDRTPRAIGEVMKIIKPQLQGRADMKLVSSLVKASLNI